MPQDKDELLNMLKEHLRVSLNTKGDYEDNYLEVKIYWDQEEISSDAISLDYLQ